MTRTFVGRVASWCALRLDYLDARQRARRRARVVEKLLVLAEIRQHVDAEGAWDPELRKHFDIVAAEVIREAVEEGLARLAIAVIEIGVEEGRR